MSRASMSAPAWIAVTTPSRSLLYTCIDAKSVIRVSKPFLTRVVTQLEPSTVIDVCASHTSAEGMHRPGRHRQGTMRDCARFMAIHVYCMHFQRCACRSTVSPTWRKSDVLCPPWTRNAMWQTTHMNMVPTAKSLSILRRMQAVVPHRFVQLLCRLR